MYNIITRYSVVEKNNDTNQTTNSMLWVFPTVSNDVKHAQSVKEHKGVEEFWQFGVCSIVVGTVRTLVWATDEADVVVKQAESCVQCRVVIGWKKTVVRKVTSFVYINRCLYQVRIARKRELYVVSWHLQLGTILNREIQSKFL